MASLAASLLLVLFQCFSLSYGQTGSSWYFEAKEGAEKGPKCNVHYTWSHIIHSYTMMCFQCGTKYTAVFRFESKPIGALALTDCHQTTSNSVTVMSPVLDEPPVHDPDQPLKELKQLPLIHQIQFDTTMGQCVKLVYRQVDGKWVPKEANCDQTTHWWSKVFKGFSNSWKLMKMSPNLGVVRKIRKVTDSPEVGCDSLRSLQFKVGKFWMRCSDCGEEYLAVIYEENTPMAAANVGSCSYPFLEDSISVMPFRTETMVEYLMVSNHCIMIDYHKVDHVFKESKKAKCLAPAGSWSSRFEYFMLIFGYRNGWKTKIVV